MDRRVKERLIGATILVVLAVLFVPELLSGPSRPRAAPTVDRDATPMRTYTLEVGSAAAIAPQISTAAAPAPAPTTAPATPAAQIAAASSVATPAPNVAAASPSPPRLAAVDPSPPDAPAAAELPAPRPATQSVNVAKAAGARLGAGLWSIQLGSFASAGNAEHLVRDVRSKGFKAYTLSSGRGSKTRHKVRVGPFADRASAERAEAQLRTHGHLGALVGP